MSKRVPTTTKVATDAFNSRAGDITTHDKRLSGLKVAQLTELKLAAEFGYKAREKNQSLALMLMELEEMFK